MQQTDFFLKFGTHIAYDSTPNWLTFQGHESKVKATASEEIMILATFISMCMVADTGVSMAVSGRTV